MTDGYIFITNLTTKEVETIRVKPYEHVGVFFELAKYFKDHNLFDKVKVAFASGSKKFTSGTVNIRGIANMLELIGE